MRRPPWLDGYALAAMLLCGVAVGASLLIDPKGGFVNFLTEIAGALLGAGLTAFFIDRQSRRRQALEQDKRWRSRLAQDLAHNLGAMVIRTRTYATPGHTAFRADRDTIHPSLDAMMTGRKHLLTRHQAIGIAMMLPASGRPESLWRSAIDQAIAEGVFVSSEHGELRPSPLHSALEQVRNDLDPYVRQTWVHTPENLAAVMANLSPGIAAKEEYVTIDGYSLMNILVYYDRAEDLFQSQVLALRLVLQLTDPGPEYARRPVTPLGEEQEQNLAAETVNADEIVLLTKRGVWPFGPSIAADMFGETDEQKRTRLAELWRVQFRRIGAYPEKITDDAIDRLVEAILGTLVPPEDGIPRIQSARAETE